MSRHRPADWSNVEALQDFWRRRSFHDMVIEDVFALNRRAVIRLHEFTLIVAGVTELKTCPLPDVWLSQSIVTAQHAIMLDVKTEQGRLAVAGADVRLIRNNDFSILIPPVDG